MLRSLQSEKDHRLILKINLAPHERKEPILQQDTEWDTNAEAPGNLLQKTTGQEGDLPQKTTGQEGGTGGITLTKEKDLGKEEDIETEDIQILSNKL